MAIYKYRQFQQWMVSSGLTDSEAVDEMDAGLYGANLGSGLHKKRIAMPGKGKRGSYRTLLAFKQGKKAFFVYGYAKNVKANINKNEKEVYRKLAKELLGLDDSRLVAMLITGKLIEVK